MGMFNIIDISILVIILIVYIIDVVIQIKKQGFKKYIIKLIVDAESNFEYGRNSEKFNYVFDRAYEFLPKSLKLLITKPMLIRFIQKVFDEIKLALDYKN